MTYGHPHGWLVLVVVMAISAWVRHFFNLRHQGRTVWAIPLTGAVAIVLLALATSPRGLSPPSGASLAVAGAVDFSTVQHIITRRCTPCHSVRPPDPTFIAAPKSVMFDTPEQMRDQARSIYQQAVLAKTMPLANLTRMTQEEREIVAAWVGQGARIP